jgi:hypothetical protein
MEMKGGYANSATVEFLRNLPENIELWHFGDSDPKGFDILRDLRVHEFPRRSRACICASGRTKRLLLFHSKIMKPLGACSIRSSFWTPKKMD